jgi:hypothetical protein
MPLLGGGDPTPWGDDVVFSEQEETLVAGNPKWAYFKHFAIAVTGRKAAFRNCDQISGLRHQPGGR